MKPVAVLISDVHYSLSTLALADAAMRLAIAKANVLQVPLIVAGDLHDTKANMRAECVNAMIETFSLCETTAFVLRGNHDQINEKSDAHALNFLSSAGGNINVLDFCDITLLGHIIPYHHDPEALRAYLKTIPKGSTIIMHQGIEGSHSGDYIQDKSAIRPEDVAGMRVISGHYHRRQDIVLPEGGLWSYIGNPYTLNYAEAEDPPKGFQVLMDDGSLEFIPTNLREHRVMDLTFEELKGEAIFLGEDCDLLWVKVRGTKDQLAVASRPYVATMLDIHQPFRLDLIPTDSGDIARNSLQAMSGGELIDSIVDQRQDLSEGQAARLKSTWRRLTDD